MSKEITLSMVDGVRVVSKERADAVKAAMWAVDGAKEAGNGFNVW